MKTQEVRRLYGKLDGAERFGLALAALARGDVAEGEHLEAGSPVVTSIRHEAGFGDAVSAALGLGWTLGIQAAARIGWLDALALVQEHLEQEPGDADSDAEALLRHLGWARAVAARELASILRAFSEACEKVPGIDPEVFVQAMPPPVSGGIERHRSALEEAGTDPEQVKAAGEVFAEVLSAIGL